MIRPLTNKKQKISKEMALAIRHLFRLALSSSASQLSGAFVLLPTRYASRCLCFGNAMCQRTNPFLYYFVTDLVSLDLRH